MKRTLSFALVLCILLSCIVIFSGCGSKKEKDWPVTIGDVTIEKEPENVVVLNDTFADIISYIGYDVKLVGRSESCDQDFLHVVPTVGSAASPDVSAISAAGTDLVIADSTLSAAAKSTIESNGAKVVTLSAPTSEGELKDLYINLGKALGGNSTGGKKGEDGYDDLFELLDTMNTATSDIVQTVGYLYLDENNQLCTFVKGSLPFKFFNYNGKSNVFANQEAPAVNLQELRIGSPNYIFYDSDEVLTVLAADDQLANVNALKNNKTCKIAKKAFERYGSSTVAAVYEMLDYIEKDNKATPDEATPDAVPAPAATVAEQEAVAPTAAPATSAPAADDDVIEYSEDDE